MGKTLLCITILFIYVINIYSMKPIIIETLENIKNDEIIDNTFDNNNIIKKNKDNNVVVEDISSPFLKPNINKN